MTDDASLKRRLLENRFAFRLRDDAVFDEAAFIALKRDLALLAAAWDGRSEVDKEIAGWLAFLVLTIGGSVERLRRNAPHHELTNTAGSALGELYKAVESCFAAHDIARH